MTREEYIGYYDSMGGENLDVSQRIVRCRDCEYADSDCMVCYRSGDIGDDVYYPEITPNGFCSWGKREPEWLTCKCGHEMETDGICPMCGRYVGMP